MPSEHLTIGPMLPLPADSVLAIAPPKDRLNTAVKIITICLIQAPLGLSLIEINKSMDKDNKISKIG